MKIIVAHLLLFALLYVAQPSAAEVSRKLRFLDIDPPEKAVYLEENVEMTLSSPSPEPSAEPSAEPTAEPTAKPTISPTGPSASPSKMPSPRPTKAPTVVPTQRPTPLPGDPTLAPTYAPSTAGPTAWPTPAPSKQVSPIVSFTANLTMGGLPSPELDAGAQAAIVNVTAFTMHIPMNTVSYVGGIFTEELRRRLADRANKISLFSTTYSAIAITKVVIPLSATTYTSTAQLYQALTSQLETAVYSGAFTTQLRLVALAYNTTAFLTVNVTSVSPSLPTVQNPVPDDDDDHNLVNPSESADLSGGAIASIVIGAFFGAVLLGIVLYYIVFVKSGLMKVADSSLMESRSVPLSVMPVSN